MKDEKGVEIKVGDLIKRRGEVLYADGWKSKLSNKTWKVSKVEDIVYYQDENGNDVPLPLPKKNGAYVIVDESWFTPVDGVKAGGISQKYRIHFNDKERDWKEGDIVQITGNVSEATLKSGKLEKVPDTELHKHVLIVADPLKIKGFAN